MRSYRGVEIGHVGTRRHTWTSQLSLRKMPTRSRFAAGPLAHPALVERDVLDADNRLLPGMVPTVVIEKYVGFSGDAASRHRVEQKNLTDDIEAHLAAGRPLGYVLEGNSPYGEVEPWREAVLRRAAFAGVPVVKCGRGTSGGFVPYGTPPFISGSNLSSTKARILLMAVLLSLGSLPTAADPALPTDDEIRATDAAVRRYQDVFDQH
jgi:hypothetical protein